MSVVWFLNKVGEVTLEQWEVHSGKRETWLEARSTVVWFTVAGGGRWGCNRRAWKLEVQPLGEGPPAPQRQEESKQVRVYPGGSAGCLGWGFCMVPARQSKKQSLAKGLGNSETGPRH